MQAWLAETIAAAPAPLRALALSLCGGLAALAAGTAVAQDLPDPGQTYIQNLTVVGGGCPMGTVSSNLSPDRQAITVLFSQFLVEGGRLTGQATREIACAVRLNMHVPAGYSFSLYDINTRGFASLEQNTTGYARTEFRFGDSPVGLVKLGQETLQGPFNDNYQLTTRVAAAGLSWSPCTDQSQLFVLRATLGVNGRHGLMTVDSLDAQVTQRYAVSWRRCTDPGAGYPVRNLFTTGTVRKNTSLCMNVRQGRLYLSSTAPNIAGQAYAKLKHEGIGLTNQPLASLSKDSFNTNLTDTYKVPGDWNAVTAANPNVTVTATNPPAQPRSVVDRPDPNTVCVRILDAPAQIRIGWRPSPPL